MMLNHLQASLAQDSLEDMERNLRLIFGNHVCEQSVLVINSSFKIMTGRLTAGVIHFNVSEVAGN